MIVDLFAGPGGWDLGARMLGLDPLGVELNHDACLTRAAAGLRTLEGNVAEMDPHAVAAGGCEGFIASPPCTAFSTAGKGKGRAHLEALVAAIEAGDWSARPDPDPTVWLCLEVGRWVEALQPRWIACEQVPSVLPLWQAYARWLEARGYSAWAGRVSAEQYGVPQTRQRALLLASLDRRVGAPTPTHQKYVARSADKGRLGLLLPWVSMAEALGWGPAGICAPTVTAGGTDTGGAEPFGKGGRSRILNTGRDWKAGGSRADAQTRPGDEPSPTVATVPAQWNWEDGPDEERLPGLGGQRVAADVAERKPWADERPATAIAGRPLVADPGANANRFNGATKSRNDGIKVTISDVLTLQSFPPGYPLQGNRSSQFKQVGNAVPPLLAAHALAAVLGMPAPAA